MQVKDGFFCHRVLLIALFILGNAIITIPLTQNGVMGIIGFSIASVVGFIFAAIISLVAKKLKNKSINSVLKRILCGVWLVFLLVLLFDCCRDYVLFTDTTKMPNSSALVIAVAFLALSLYCGYHRPAVLFRAALVCFFICLLIFFTLTMLSLSRINTQTLNISFSENGLKDLLLKAFLPTIVAYYFVGGDKNGTCVTLIGTLLGSIFLMLCGALCLLVLGNTINLIDYPLATVGGIISIGKGFMRFEGFVYLIIMLTSFIKTSVIVHLILNIFKPKRFIRP